MRGKASHIFIGYTLLSLLLCLFIASTAHAQTDRRKNYDALAVKTGEKDFSYTDYVFNFKYINDEFYFQDPDLLTEILVFEQNKNYKKLVIDLEDYVSNFGVKNFYTDTKYLWKLAQIYHKTEKEAKSRSLIRLVLKHTRSDISKVKNYYDSISVNDRIYYVPLKHYYELVEYRKAIDTLHPPQSVLTRMYDGVNSKYADYAPSLSFTEDTLLFSSKRNKHPHTGKPNEDLFLSVAYANTFEEEQPITALNTEYNEGSAILTKDGQTMFFARCDAPEGFGNCDIYQAKWNETEKKWGDIKNLGPNVNGHGWESQPCLSFTEDTLYFASDRLGGFGMSDIYFCIKQRNGTWGRALNMGPVINTRNSEVSPFIHHQYNVLYFSSNGQLVNFGDFDIYKSYKRDNYWSEPKNIGPLVNGEGSEYYFTIDKKSQKLYYARSEKEDLKNLDLYSFPLPMEAQPLATTKLSGKLTDSTGKPLQGVVSIIDLDKGIEVAPQALRPDGTYDFDLIRNNNYLLVIQGDEFFRIQDKFYLAGDTSIDKKTKKISNIKISFASLEFKAASTDILPSMYEDLKQVENFMIDNPTFNLKISGHTDQFGKAESNKALSLNRATSIKIWLTEEEKIDPSRIEAIGYGSSKPIILEEKTEADRRINRRVEFEIVPPNQE
jgi:outer membrane protein OmpA-like peptidoglycan-associated protein